MYCIFLCHLSDFVTTSDFHNMYHIIIVPCVLLQVRQDGRQSLDGAGDSGRVRRDWRGGGAAHLREPRGDAARSNPAGPQDGLGEQERGTDAGRKAAARSGTTTTMR